MSYTEVERQQDITYILHIANEFKDSLDIEESFEIYDNVHVTNAIMIPQITISPQTKINKGIEQFISYIYALSDSSTSSNYTIFCTRELMEKFFNKLHKPPRDTTLGSLWSFEVTFYEDNMPLNAKASIIQQDSTRDRPVINSTGNTEQLEALEAQEVDYYGTTLSTIPGDNRGVVTIYKKKTFCFICDAYSIQDYMKTKIRPRPLQDESLTLWGIFTSLLRSHILLSRYLMPGVSDDFFYVSEKVTSWMTFICLYIPVLYHYSESPVINVKVSYLLNSGNHDEVELKDKQKKMENFFNYLFLISTALQQLYPDSRERQQPPPENITDLINAQLLLIIDFFKRGKKVIFIYENKSQQITFGMIRETNNVSGTIVPYDEPLPEISFIRSQPLPILSSEIKFYRGMCDPQKSKSRSKISQHCEYLYSNRRDYSTRREILSLCSDRIEKAKETLANTYLSNCKNRIADTMVPVSGGFIKRKRKKTHRKKNTRRKNRKDKTRKKYKTKNIHLI
jgi:hypothetical protein